MRVHFINKTLSAAGLLILIALVSAPSHAISIQWRATLDQAQEVPAPIPVPTATGFASGSLDLDTLLLSWEILFEGLSGPAVGMHFHGPAGAGETAGVVVNIGNISGLSSPSNGSTTISAQDAADFQAGLWYINVHTALNPPGEIRGQAQVIPVPSVLMLVALGLLALRWSLLRRLA